MLGWENWGTFSKKKGHHSKPKLKKNRSHEYANIRGQKPTATQHPGKQFNLINNQGAVNKKGRERNAGYNVDTQDTVLIQLFTFGSIVGIYCNRKIVGKREV